MAEPRVALPPALPSELLEYILSHQAHPTTLLICTSQATFMSTLKASTPSTSPLLLATLHQLATSRYVTTVFTPTLTHLRAYLAIFPDLERDKPVPPDTQWQRPGTEKPSLVVFGLLECHRYTGEWSAQGLGCSLAALAEAGRRGGRRVVVIEERKLDIEPTTSESLDRDEERGEEPEDSLDEMLLAEEAGVHEGDSKNSFWKGWYERVPMLNGSGPRPGVGNEDAAWSGRTVEVGKIFGRWFNFRKGIWEDNSS